MTTREEAAQARAEAGTRLSQVSTRHRRALEDEGGSRGYALGGTMTLRSAGEGSPVYRAEGVTDGPGVIGLASRTEVGYEMFDFFGPYTEIVSRGAFDETLAADPLVEFTLNHNKGGGAPMAHTRNGTLMLAISDEGLTYDASVDGTRTDVSDMLKALQRGDLAESSFKFTIEAGQWSPDYTEYRIEKANLHRGDVSSVNFGASPTTTSAARSLEKIQAIRALDPEDVNMLTQAMAWLTAVDSIVDEAQEALAAYLKVPSPDPDDAADMPMLSASKPALRYLPEYRTIRGL